jgi:hypothetical protein
MHKEGREPVVVHVPGPGEGGAAVALRQNVRATAGGRLDDDGLAGQYHQAARNGQALGRRFSSAHPTGGAIYVDPRHHPCPADLAPIQNRGTYGILGVGSRRRCYTERWPSLTCWYCLWVSPIRTDPRRYFRSQCTTIIPAPVLKPFGLKAGAFPP